MVVNEGFDKKIYYIIPNNNFITYIRDIEFRLNIKTLNKIDKFGELLDIFKYISDTNLNKLYNYDYLNSISEY